MGSVIEHIDASFPEKTPRFLSGYFFGITVIPKLKTVGGSGDFSHSRLPFKKQNFGGEMWGVSAFLTFRLEGQFHSDRRLPRRLKHTTLFRTCPMATTHKLVMGSC